MRYSLLIPLASLLLGTLPALGQPHPVPPAPDASAWMDSVQHLSLPQQVAAVRARAWRDTLLAPYQPQVCWLPVPPTALRPAAAPAQPVRASQPCVPLLYIVEDKPFFLNDAATMGEFQRLLQSQPIRQVTLLRDVAATAIYGARGATGAVVMSSKKPKRR